MHQTHQNSNYYYRAAQAALQSDKPVAIWQYCQAAIAERERGERELSRIGADLITLIGGVKMPPVTLTGPGPEPRLALLDKLYGLAGDLDLAGQGGTTPAADERLWQEFKRLVRELEGVQ